MKLLSLSWCLFLSLTACTGQEECSDHDGLASHGGKADVHGIESINEPVEALSLMQVRAGKLLKAVSLPSLHWDGPRTKIDELNAPPESLAETMTAPSDAISEGERHSSAHAIGVAVASIGDATKNKAPAPNAFAAFLQQAARAKGVNTFAIIFVAVTGLAATCMLASVVQSGQPVQNSVSTSTSKMKNPRCRQASVAGNERAIASGEDFRSNAGTRTGTSPSLPALPAYRHTPAWNHVRVDDRPAAQALVIPSAASVSASESQSRRSLFLARPASAQNSAVSMPREHQPAKLSSIFNPSSATDLMTTTLETPTALDMRPPEVTGIGNPSTKRPPPLCAMLVMPHCEVFFAVPVDQLLAGVNTVEVIGLSGNALLRATLKDTFKGRILEMSMSPPRSPPLASISEAAEYGPWAGIREIMLCSPSAPPEHYGLLRPCSKGHVLQCGEHEVMTMTINATNGACQLSTGNNCDVLAEACRSRDGEGIFDPEDLEVRVSPGMDAVLSLLCVVSSALFEH